MSLQDLSTFALLYRALLIGCCNTTPFVFGFVFVVSPSTAVLSSAVVLLVFR
jgi:hypothetical protein